MIIQKAEIKGFRRMALNNIETIVIEPDRKFHWVLGSNGSGKSSLFSELIPLAANHTSFKRGGYVKLHILHRGIRYRLESDFTETKNTFRFIQIVNDTEIELNPGHTATVFNNLCYQHFGINKETKEFCLGKRLFTNMSSADRKGWLTKISDVDFSYALDYFKRLLKSYRNILGSIKTDQERLAIIKTRATDKEIETGMKERIDYLRNLIKVLNEYCPNPSLSFHDYEEMKGRLESEIEASLSSVRGLLASSKELIWGYTPERAEKDYTEAVSVVEGMTGSLNFMYEELDSVLKELDKYVDVRSLSGETITKEIQETELKINSLVKSLEYEEVSDPQKAKYLFKNWISELPLYLENLVEDVNGEFNRENFEVQKHALEKAQQALYSCQERIERIREALGHKENCEETKTIRCPSCSFEWKLGEHTTSPEQLQALLVEGKNKEKQIISTIEVLEEDMKKHLDHFKGLDYLNSFNMANPLFQPFWVFVMSEGLHLNSVDTIRNMAFHFGTHIDKCEEIKTLEENLRSLNEKKILQKAFSEETLSKLDVRRKELEVKIAEALIKKDEANKLANRAKYRQGVFNFLKDKNERGYEFLERLSSISLIGQEHFERSFIGDELSKLNMELMDLERSYREIEIRKGQMQMLEDNLAEAEKLASALKAAVDSLSPTKGLIAKGLSGFINHFVGIVNSIIRKVWLYPMELIPILPDEDSNIELNYNFKVKVRDEEVPEISECSNGQKEIINLAIRIASMSFLKMDDYPLFLDEFGESMDHAHRASAFEMITTIMVNSSFPQIFMISHFENSFTQGLEADVTVLCPANVNIPSNFVYNQRTRIN